MGTKHRLFAVAIAGAIALVTTQVPPAEAATVPGKEKVLFVAEVSDFISLDPVISGATQDRGIQHIMYNGLVRWNKDVEIVPDLATSWDLAPDGVTWTFKLRSDVKFWDGSPVRPQDIKFSIDRVLNPATNAFLRSVYTKIKEVKVIGPSTLQIVTNAPAPSLLDDLADGSVDVLSEAFVQKVGKQYGKSPDTTMGSGPYRIVEWKPGDRTVLVANEKYHLGKPHLDRVIYRHVPESSSRVAMLRTGEAHIINKVPPEEVPSLRKDRSIRLLEVPSAQQIGFELNVGRPPLQDRRARLALNMAIDRKAIIEAVLGGLGDAAVSPTGPVSGRATFAPYPYDPPKAKDLLAQAGYPGGFDLTLITPNGRYLKDKESAEAIQAYLKEVGIRAKVEIREWAAMPEVWDADPMTYPKQAWMVGRSAPSLDFNLRRLFHTEATFKKGSGNFTAYKNPAVDTLLDKARQTFDIKQRQEFYRQAQEELWKDPPFLFLWTTRQVIGARPNVTGLVVLPRERLLLNDVDLK